MVNQIYPVELRLNKANTHFTVAPFLYLHQSISKIYDTRDDSGFDTVTFRCLNRDVPRRPSYGAYLSQLIRFARVCSHLENFKARNEF